MDRSNIGASSASAAALEARKVLHIELPAPSVETIDYALSAHRDRWLRAAWMGDPSFDAFTRLAGNPIHRSAPPLEWAVNGFLFIDPVSRDWFVYVGHYPEGYFRPDLPTRMCCTVYRSRDRGQSWEHLGPIFPPEEFTFNGMRDPAVHAPDVSVVYDGGRYHLVYDWLCALPSWPAENEGGIGYAWSDRPEGPFHRHAEAVFLNPRFVREPIAGKYRRLYGPTLLRRKDDWLLLVLADSGRHHGWGLAWATAKRPEGPYSDPKLLLSVESDTFYPPAVEHFPAFIHNGYVYSQATSTALNRDFQVVYRAPVDEATRPEAWELVQYGSVWHAEPVEHESKGMWGQTYSGAVDEGGTLYAMFPSRDSRGMGTINLAKRPWNRPHVERGFTISAHDGPALSVINRGYGAADIELSGEIRGTATLLIDYRGALGPDVARHDCSPHRLAMSRYVGAKLTPERWSLIAVGADTQTRVIAAGVRSGSAVRLRLHRDLHGATAIEIDGQHAWSGVLQPLDEAGAIGLLVDPGGHLRVERFVVTAEPRPLTLAMLYSEALLGAGQAVANGHETRFWQERTDGLFRHGVGAVYQEDGGRAKWNFFGEAATLWSPRGPEFGEVDVLIDGERRATLNLHAEHPEPSSPVFDSGALACGFHALVIRGRSGRLVADSIDVHFAR